MTAIKAMKWKLGIDKGGFYTDAVIRKAKAATTKENLTIRTKSAIEQLHIENTENIQLVCLSTTLATNATLVVIKGAETVW